MKKVEAVIKPFRLPDVEKALDAMGIRTFAASEIRLYGDEGRRSGFPADTQAPAESQDRSRGRG